MKQRKIRDKALDLHDAAISALYRIEALAGLMQAAAGGRDGAEPLDAHEIEETTGIICEETTKVRAALRLLRGWTDSTKANRTRDRSSASK